MKNYWIAVVVTSAMAVAAAQTGANSFHVTDNGNPVSGGDFNGATGDVKVRTSSANAPAISTPVGPPPTTTKVSSALRRAGSSSQAASSQRVRM